MGRTPLCIERIVIEAMTAPTDADVERVARALYDLEPFYMPSGQMHDGMEMARKFSFDHAPAYRQERAREQARAALAAMQDRRAGWLPIETAPRDGTRILAGWPHDGWREIVRWENNKVGWRGDVSGYWAPKDFAPVWQPLPPPPEKADE
jgi:hypothetical protein